MLLPIHLFQVIFDPDKRDKTQYMDKFQRNPRLRPSLTQFGGSHVDGFIAVTASGLVISHYDNTPTQCTAIFDGCKNGNFQMNNRNIFLIFAQNIYPTKKETHQ